MYSTSFITLIQYGATRSIRTNQPPVQNHTLIPVSLCSYNMELHAVSEPINYQFRTTRSLPVSLRSYNMELNAVSEPINFQFRTTRSLPVSLRSYNMELHAVSEPTNHQYRKLEPHVKYQFHYVHTIWS